MFHMYYTRSFVAKKAIIAHPIKKVKSSFFYHLGDTVLQIILRQFNASTAGGQRKKGFNCSTQRKVRVSDRQRVSTINWKKGKCKEKATDGQERVVAFKHNVRRSVSSVSVIPQSLD